MTSAQDIEYWLQRCSICFDAQLDFCLELCRDQFCRDCFQRYVKEVVQNSWGLGITKVKCPVCQDVIQQSEWSKYVDQNVIDLYNTYNKPYRSFSRCCSECGEEVFAAQVFQVCAEEKEKYFKEISILLRKYFDTYGSGKNCKGKNTLNRITKNQNDIDSFLEKYQTDYLAYISGEDPKVGVLEMYEYIAKKLGESLGLSMDVDNRRPSKFSRRKLKTHTDMVKSAAEISSKVVALEVRPDAWKELQFMHVANFPQSHCTRCNNDICLQCGESTHHPGMTCIQFMRYKVANPHLFIINHCHALENMKWKLANSKSCPNCSILINRDDGCNKVDCLHCGYRFCWICRNRWSENCGFYKCRMAKSKRKRDKEKYPAGNQRQRTSPFKRQAQMPVQEVALENNDASEEAGQSQETRDD
ncbi:8137_t:CDS:2, partial [Cetraspora pellucida]